MLYHKIYAPWKRDVTSHKLTDEPVDDTAKQMVDSDWMFTFTEKVDGTNIRVIWDGHRVTIGGRTENANIPGQLVTYLTGIFTEEMFEERHQGSAITLIGEGVGPKIQGSGKYLRDGETAGFILFDVFVPEENHPIGGWWLEDDAVLGISNQWGVKKAPIVDKCSLWQMRECIEDGFTSHFDDFVGEGVVGRPAGGIFNRRGERVIYKLKGIDYA